MHVIDAGSLPALARFKFLYNQRWWDRSRFPKAQPVALLGCGNVLHGVEMSQAPEQVEIPPWIRAPPCAITNKSSVSIVTSSGSARTWR